MEAVKKDWTLSQLAMMTGLSDRMLRNHLASGVLQGTKINGKWYFTTDQINAFTKHPAVKPGIVAKQNAEVYDFLFKEEKARTGACMIIDFPQVDKQEVCQYFIDRIRKESMEEYFSFAFDGESDVPRVILRGATVDVLRMVNGFMQKMGVGQSEE